MNIDMSAEVKGKTPKQSLSDAIKASKERMRKMIDELPEIHWEILGCANTHSKEEVIQKYPDHIDFINKIIWHNKDEEGVQAPKSNLNQQTTSPNQ